MTSLLRFATVRHASPVRGLSRLIDVLALRRSRQSLATLDDHMLRDIGVSREQAQSEADRAAWDVSPTWRR